MGRPHVRVSGGRESDTFSLLYERHASSGCLRDLRTIGSPPLRPKRILLAVLGALLLAAGVVAYTRLRATHHHETAQSAERAVLKRQLQGLSGLLAATERGPLVSFDKVLVTVDEELVQGILETSLPIEAVVGGRFRVKVTRAKVQFEDGFALVTLEGRASMADRPQEDTFADVLLYGALGIVDLDPVSGTLRGRVTLIAFDARQVGVMGVGARPAEGLVEDLGREKLEAFAPLLSDVEIPVAVQGGIALPGLNEGGVRIEAASLPLRVAVLDVNAFRRKLWISVDASTTPASPAPSIGPSKGAR